MEGNLDQLIKLIFEGDTKAKNSIQFSGSFDSTKDLFEALLMIFTGGMKRLFSNSETSKPVNLENLSQENFNLFSQKFQSIGITPIHKKFHLVQVNKVRDMNITPEIQKDWESQKSNYKDTFDVKYINNYNLVNNNKLEDYYFSLQVKHNIYVIHFELNS